MELRSSNCKLNPLPPDPFRHQDSAIARVTQRGRGGAESLYDTSVGGGADRCLPHRPGIAHDPSRTSRLQHRLAKFSSLRGKSRRARGHAIFTSDFRCQANALNSMAFQRVLRGRQQCVLWKYGHWHSANIKEWAEFLLTRNSDVKKKGGKFSRRNPLKNTNSFSRNSRLSQTNFCARNCCVGRTDRHLMGSPKPRLRVGAFFIRTPRE
jgi:hypothetical protein